MTGYLRDQVHFRRTEEEKSSHLSFFFPREDKRIAIVSAAVQFMSQPCQFSFQCIFLQFSTDRVKAYTQMLLEDSSFFYDHELTLGKKTSEKAREGNWIWNSITMKVYWLIIYQLPAYINLARFSLLICYTFGSYSIRTKQEIFRISLIRLS